MFHHVLTSPGSYGGSNKIGWNFSAAPTRTDTRAGIFYSITYNNLSTSLTSRKSTVHLQNTSRQSNSIIIARTVYNKKLECRGKPRKEEVVHTYLRPMHMNRSIADLLCTVNNLEKHVRRVLFYNDTNLRSLDSSRTVTTTLALRSSGWMSPFGGGLSLRRSQYGCLFRLSLQMFLSAFQTSTTSLCSKHATCRVNK